MLSITETVNLEYIHSAKAYKNEHNKRTSRLKKKKKFDIKHECQAEENSQMKGL